MKLEAWKNVLDKVAGEKVNQIKTTFSVQSLESILKEKYGTRAYIGDIEFLDAGWVEDTDDGVAGKNKRIKTAFKFEVYNPDTIQRTDKAVEHYGDIVVELQHLKNSYTCSIWIEVG